ncbi:MAG: 7-cyano-7-deazaguanine synthase [Candidatus Bathyarchaeia archaeon]
MEAEKRKPKALVLLSGGLDSLLATKIILDQGVDVEAIHFIIPFHKYNHDMIDKLSEELNIKIHEVHLGQEFLDIVANPRYGYGSQMNPCIDCRILMFRKAKELAEKIGADFLVTGEVLDERPFSQRLKAMLLIEREAGLEGKILRPLSAKLLPPTEAEKAGLINREKLLAIRGRRRIQQIKLAIEYGIKNYPTPSGGCLLTDPAFARRVKDHLQHEGRLTPKDAKLLMIGRHFRINGVKVIVGRNMEENDKLYVLSEQYNILRLMVKDYKGPITLITDKCDLSVVRMAAAITVRYSDAPKDVPVRVIYKHAEGESEIDVTSIDEGEIERLRV